MDHYIICHPTTGERFGAFNDLAIALELAQDITFRGIRQNTPTPTVVRAIPGEHPVAAFRPLPDQDSPTP